MVEMIIKYLLLGALGLAAIIFVVILIVDDELIHDVAGGAAEPLLEIKHGVTDTASSKSDSFVYWIRSSINNLLNFSPTNRTPKVSMRLPPPPKMPKPRIMTKQAPVEEAVNTADPVQHENPMPAASEPEAIAMPAAPPPEPAPASPMPEPMAKTEDHASPPRTEPPVSALSDSATTEGAPAPAPVSDVAEKPLGEAAPEQASLVPPKEAAHSDAPPPPPAAEQQSPGEADYQQGLAFYKGTGVERNFGKAAQFFLKAAEVGHVGAQYNLGIMNFIGQTGGQDFVNAAKWFEKAASNGHAQAQYNLGLLYYEGKGVAQDANIALDWIERAASQGYAKAITARDALKQALSQNTGS